jgi:hypothetical protein
MWDHKILYAGRSSKINNFLKNQKYEHGGQLKVKICILFHGNDNSQIAALRQIKLCTAQSWTLLQVLLEQLFSLTEH